MNHAPPQEAGLIRHPYKTKTPRVDIGRALAFGSSSHAEDQFTEVLRAVRPDVVHWHNTKGFIPTPQKCSPSRSIYTAHDYYLVCPRSNLLKPNLEACATPRLCQACLMRWGKPPQLWRIGRRRTVSIDKRIAVISPSEFMAARLASDGIETSMILRNFVPDSGRRKDATGGNLDTIVYLGLIETHKGVFDLLRAFSHSAKEHDFRLVFIGEGSMRGSLVHERDKLGLKGRVDIAGFLGEDQLAMVLERAAAQVIPSIWYENAPLVALEAMARGIPIIGSDRGGLAELLTPDAGASVFRAGDTRGLSKCISDLWTDRSGLTIRSGKARGAYESLYSPSIHVKRYLDFVRLNPND